MNTTEHHTQRLKDEKAAARYLNLSLSSLRRLKASGDLPYVRTGLRGLRFDITDLDELIERRKCRQQPKITGGGPGGGNAAAAHLQ